MSNNGLPHFYPVTFRQRGSAVGRSTVERATESNSESSVMTISIIIPVYNGLTFRRYSVHYAS